MTVSVRLEGGEICTGEPVEIPAWQSDPDVVAVRVSPDWVYYRQADNRWQRQGGTESRLTSTHDRMKLGSWDWFDLEAFAPVEVWARRV